MKRNLTFAILISLLSFSAIAVGPPSHANNNDRAASVQARGENGIPTFVIGKLGTMTNPSRAIEVLRANGDLFDAVGNEDFEVTRSSVDELGNMHVRVQESYRGLRIWGADLVVHADQNGEVFAIGGRFVPGRDLPHRQRVSGEEAIRNAAIEAGIADWTPETSPELAYMMNEKGVAFLTWSSIILYSNDEGEQRDRIFADAITTDLVGRHPLIHHALNRATYSANNGTSLPGTLKRSEGQAATTDAVVNAAHDYAGVVYNYYSSRFARDSYNAAGAQIKSTVHYSTNYNNAYWNGSQMVYGDGDGSTFIPLSQGFDVVAHELTHAVTQYESNLTYSNESGALNEAMSDIMAASAEAYKNGTINSNTWKIGEDIYTPGVSGDALRYMNDPVADGSSYDYYPTRYTGTQDNGGVHLNSGIANLAFYLLVQGGSHPRGKTSVVVPALGLTQSEKIFYTANRDYMTASTNFEGARNATALAAKNLYGATAESAVHKAWDAVGVPGGPVSVVTLTNGQTVSSLAGSTGSWKYYVLTVPSGQSQLNIATSGGTGDLDLYVKRGALPTSSSYDYRPYKTGNAETVTVTNPAAGDWYIGLYAYSSYSGASLNSTYSGGSSSCTTYTGSLSGAGASYYAPSSSGFSAAAGTHTGKLTGPSGADFDLYLQKKSGTSTWSNVASGTGSTSTENVTYNGTSGTYRWRVYSYSGSGSFTLCTTKP